MRRVTFRLLSRTRPWVTVCLSVLLLLAVSLMDWRTGPDFGMDVFYLLPVAWVTVALGWRAGAAVAVLTVAVWTAAELLGAANYSDWSVAILNALMRMVYLALIVYLLSVWRDRGQELERQVDERTRDLVAEVAERRHAEQAVHRLAMQVADAENAERRRIAQDIHDTVGQSLTLVKFRLQTAATATAVAAGAAARPVVDAPSQQQLELDETLGLLDDAIRQTRTLTFELHPPMLDDLGLAAALRWLARESTRQTGTEVTVTEEGEPRLLRRPVASCLFRSIRELLNNSIKHGRSTEVVITLHWRPQSVRAVVDDNGEGFDAGLAFAAAAATDAAPLGLGLASVRERFSTLGGSLSVESDPGKGARVIIDVPADSAAHQE
jgi:signal transduction histidine kinase